MKVQLDPSMKTAKMSGFLRRWPTLWLALLATIGPAGAFAAAPDKIAVENIRVGFDSPGKGPNTFKIGTWTPVWVQLRAGPERFSGFMEVLVHDDDGTPVAYRMPVEVGANKSERFTAYVRPARASPRSRSACSTQTAGAPVVPPRTPRCRKVLKRSCRVKT